MTITPHRRRIIEEAIPRLRQLAALEQLVSKSRDAGKESVSLSTSYAAAHELQAIHLEAELIRADKL